MDSDTIRQVLYEDSECFTPSNNEGLSFTSDQCITLDGYGSAKLLFNCQSGANQYVTTSLAVAKFFMLRCPKMVFDVWRSQKVFSMLGGPKNFFILGITKMLFWQELKIYDISGLCDKFKDSFIYF